MHSNQCEGQRPSCTKCVQAGESCVYEVAEDQTRYTALKKNNQTLLEDNSEMQQLFDCLRTRSETEALAILHRLRSGADPTSVLNMVRDSDLLLQASTGQRSGYDIDGDVDHEAKSTRPEHKHKNKNTQIATQGKSRSRSDSRSDGTFETDHGATAEKLAVLERKYAALQNDVDRLLELYRYLHDMPEADVTRAVQRIRSSKSPLTVMDLLSNVGSIIR